LPSGSVIDLTFLLSLADTFNIISLLVHSVGLPNTAIVGNSLSMSSLSIINLPFLSFELSALSITLAFIV